MDGDLKDNECLEDFLLHFGIKRKSGRYPWGSGKEPYQSEERKKSKKEKEPMSKEEAERRREIVLRTATASDLQKIKSEITQQELQSVINRLRLEQQLSELVAAEQKKKQQTFKNYSKKLSETVQLGRNALELYGLIVKTEQILKGNNANVVKK